MTIEPSTIAQAIEDLGEIVSRSGGVADDALDVFKDVASEYRRLQGAVLPPETAATAATLVDLMKRNLPPHISEAQQVEAYLALHRVADGGQ